MTKQFLEAIQHLLPIIGVLGVMAVAACLATRGDGERPYDFRDYSIKDGAQ